MSEFPPAPASVPSPADPTPPASAPRRAWTILGRLSKAVREQNWFAVVLELVIVVLGVVIGFQVTAWGQSRADRAKEQTYLRQLAADLRETEQQLDDTDDFLALPRRATSLIHRAFYTPTRPPTDSLLAWVTMSYSLRDLRPVVGTAEALVFTGDLSLIRSDSLRSAITGYLEAADREVATQTYYTEMVSDATLRLHESIDPAPLLKDLIPPESMEARLGLPPNETPYFEGERRTPFPFDAEQFLSDQDANVVSAKRAAAHINLWRMRGRLRAATVTLREQVDAELDR